MGTGLASNLSSNNNPKLLILQAPYFSMTDMAKRTYPIVPTFLLRYKFATNEYMKDCKMPVVILHEDEVIYYGASLKLKALFKPQDTLITLKGLGHNGITNTEIYKTEIAKILKE